jgi:hypothetical protein
MRRSVAAYICAGALFAVVVPGFAQSGIPEAKRHLPANKASILYGRVAERVSGASGGNDFIVLPGADVVLTAEGKERRSKTGSNGLFQFPGLPAGRYSLTVSFAGFEPQSREDIQIAVGEVLAVEILLRRQIAVVSESNKLPPKPGEQQNASESAYREVLRRPVGEMTEAQSEHLPADEKLAVPRPDRWNIPLPGWERYQRAGEYPYAMGRWYDPFNQNRLKGDKPIFGQQTFFSFTGTSVTAFDVRRLPIPSGVASSRPGSATFFGKGQQTFVSETVRLSFDLFHGDTSFKPVDWRIRFTPAFNVNQIWTRERGIVNIDVRKGTDRTDGHVGLQEAFAEVKVKDLSPNFDFVSVRAGIQQFSSDFRGFVFAQEQPGFRIFGNLRSNRMEYNAAYFYFLEKDTNSGLNKFASRDQQVLVANFYYQDFLFKGYTAQASYHFNKDDATKHFDENDFLVRPAAIGAVLPHDIRSHYIGLTGNGHIGRINVSNAFYQVLGFDRLNPIAGRYVDINAQMAALELSIDKDWLRFRTSAFYASGDKNPRDRIARGFDSISEAQTFAGGIFSFFNREGIPLTGTKVPLTSPDSFLPNLRASKEEGQANYVNPGIMLLNFGVDADVTTKLRAVANLNLMRFVHTEPLELLLFQSKIQTSLGADYGVGVIYRPPLSENISITAGATALTPFTGLRQIYTAKTLVSTFVLVKFQF